MRIIKEKAFYRNMFAIIIPITIQNLLSFSVNMFDTIMLGKLGENDLAASSIAGQPFFLFSIITFGIAAGAGVIISQYWGKRDIVMIKKVLSVMLKFAILISILVFAVVLIAPEFIMKLYLNSSDVNATEIIAKGASYLRIIAFTYLIYGITNTVYSALRSVEKIKVSVVSNIVAIVVNVTLNYILIFGKFGAPKLGIVGAAYGTLAARLCEMLVLIIYVKFVEKDIKFKITKDFFGFDKAIFLKYLKYSLPVIMNEAAWALGASMQTLILGKIGSEVVAANSIVSIITQLSSVFLFGIANAAAVLTGKTIGEGKDKEYIRRLSSTFQLVALGAAALSCAIILLVRVPMLSFYEVSDATKALASKLIYVSAFVIVFQAFSITNMMGILRGGGDTRFVFFLDVTFLYFMSLPLGLALGLWFKFPVPLVFLFLKSDEIVKAFLGIHRLFFKNWMTDLTDTKVLAT